MNNNNYKILIVDDEEDILQFVGYNLKKEGFDVTTANNGKKALRLAEKQIPDLIILDIMMPEMDGVEVCRQLRTQAKFDDTIIAFLTARNEDFSHIVALDEGGDDFINKPIKPRVLVSRIKALLRRSKKTAEEKKHIIKANDLIIDKESITVYRGKELIVLPKKEFELLVLLVSKPGKVFSREEIFNKVWGSDVIVGTRTIDVHIRKLREKMGDHYIKTVKGIGYKFVY
ncbi:MAG TPA: response regulator transcription factor [Bacteroidetes bacterium]|nr:response regulator transcription factor [Bacteroidota bacterium]